MPKQLPVVFSQEYRDGLKRLAEQRGGCSEASIVRGLVRRELIKEGLLTEDQSQDSPTPHTPAPTSPDPAR